MSEENHEQINENIEPVIENNTQTTNPFDQMFFGNRQRNKKEEEQRHVEHATSENSSMDGWLESILNNKNLSNIDFDELMNHVDRLIVSLNELKPMFQKVSPLLERFMQKGK